MGEPPGQPRANSWAMAWGQTGATASPYAITGTLYSASQHLQFPLGAPSAAQTTNPATACPAAALAHCHFPPPLLGALRAGPSPNLVLKHLAPDTNSPADRQLTQTHRLTGSCIGIDTASCRAPPSPPPSIGAPGAAVFAEVEEGGEELAARHAPARRQLRLRREVPADVVTAESEGKQMGAWFDPDS
jgi:hypothetical protein